MPVEFLSDEPTAGLDPAERVRFRNLLTALSRERVIILYTHIVEDIASTCNDLAVLQQGRVVFRGTPTNLAHTATGKVSTPGMQHSLCSKISNGVSRLIGRTKLEQGIGPEHAICELLIDEGVVLQM